MSSGLPFTLGADPEFACRKNGSHINASELFAYRDGYLGTDVPTTGEVRPGIAKTPDELVARIYTCFKNKSKDIPKNVSFHAGHFFDGMSLGGHLHCGIVPESRRYAHSLYFTLEFYLMECLSHLIDDMEGYEKRVNLGHYGVKTHHGKEILEDNVGAAVEIKGYGGYEYRTPGSWLVSPAVTYANVTLFALANLIAQKYQQLIYDMLPDPLTLTDEQRITHIESINKIIEVPESCKYGMELTSLLIQDRDNIDWSANFRNEWKF